MQPVNLEMLTGLKLVRMTRPKSVHVSRLARSTMLSKIRDGHRVCGPFLDQGRRQCCRLCPRTCMGCIHSSRRRIPADRIGYLLAAFMLFSLNCVAFTHYCVAPTNLEYRICALLSIGFSRFHTTACDPLGRASPWGTVESH